MKLAFVVLLLSSLCAQSGIVRQPLQAAPSKTTQRGSDGTSQEQDTSAPTTPESTPQLLTTAKSSDGKWGYKDESGSYRIPPQFDTATKFSEGLAAVALHKKVGYIDATGKMVISPQFVHGEPFHEGLALVYTTWGINVFGRTEGWDLFRRAGYIDHTGKFVIETRLTANAENFSEGVAAFQPGVATPGNAKWGYLDKTGKWAIKPQFKIATDFSEGLAAVELSTRKESSQKQPTYKWGYIDHSGNFVIPPQFLDAKPFRNGIARVSRWDMQGHLHLQQCIDKQGNSVAPCPAGKPEKIPGSTILR
jgi:WG containing repeat